MTGRVIDRNVNAGSFGQREGGTECETKTVALVTSCGFMTLDQELKKLFQSSRIRPRCISNFHVGFTDGIPHSAKFDILRDPGNQKVLLGKKC